MAKDNLNNKEDTEKTPFNLIQEKFGQLMITFHLTILWLMYLTKPEKVYNLK